MNQRAFPWAEPTIERKPPGPPKRGTQRAKILEALQQCPRSSEELNGICYRYSARICELRQAGYKIEGTPRESGLWWYRLEGEPS